MAWPVVLLLLTLSTPARAWEAPGKLDVAVHAFSEAWLLADCLQTLDIKNNSPRVHETNAILGRYPPDGKVLAYFGSVVAVTTLLWVALPERPARWMVDGGLLFWEVPVVVNNRVQWGLHFTLPY